ncbi:MAG TPA: glycosyltransferase family 2 protein, partial [Bacteroidales bacterium]|nr:glycosyltransferase family 2 protein [Bacteroidales bacterium]
MDKLPYISLILPCHNEEIFIEKCINSILENEYPSEKIELLVIDGLSTDNTVNIVKKYIDKHIKIKIFTNHKKYFPAAVNIGINNSKGDYIFILGAHAVYHKNYFSKCIETALRTNADNVGGVLITDGLNKSIIGKGITIVLSHPFGVGNSTFRTGSNKEIEVDTVFGGCYKKEVFKNIGLFNENLISSSDIDFNKRLKKNNGKIILNPSIQATYYTRTNFKKFIINNFRNGFWAVYPIKFVDYIPVSARHFIPFFFFIGITIGLFLIPFSNIIKNIYLTTICIYFLITILISLKYIFKNPLYLFILPFLFFTLH